MQGTIQDGHAPISRYSLQGLDLPVTVTKVSGISWSRDMGTLPDRRKVSGGVRQAFELTLTMPLHHKAEQVVMEKWSSDCEYPCATNYKKDLSLIRYQVTGAGGAEVPLSAKTLIGCIISGKDESDADMTDEGNPVMVDWKISVDQERVDF